MHHISKKKGKVGEMALKLDMSKAYDRVEWIWLEKIMQKLGFDDKWKALIMRCITIVSYSIKVNGKLQGRIIPSGGNPIGESFVSLPFLVVCRRPFNFNKEGNEGGKDGWYCS